jgi:hypothetical protein
LINYYFKNKKEENNIYFLENILEKFGNKKLNSQLNFYLGLQINNGLLIYE